MRKLEYKIVDLPGSREEQTAALNALGQEGWILVTLEHPGQMIAVVARDFQETDDGKGDAKKAPEQKAEAPKEKSE